MFPVLRPILDTCTVCKKYILKVMESLQKQTHVFCHFCSLDKSGSVIIIHFSLEYMILQLCLNYLIQSDPSLSQGSPHTNRPSLRQRVDCGGKPQLNTASLQLLLQMCVRPSVLSPYTGAGDCCGHLVPPELRVHYL